MRSAFVNRKATIANLRGDFLAAQRQAAESLTEMQAIGNITGSWTMHLELGQASIGLDDQAQAREHFRTALSLTDGWADHRRDEARLACLYWLAHLCILVGQFEQAQQFCQERLALIESAHLPQALHANLLLGARLFAKRGQIRPAVTLLGAAQALAGETGLAPERDSELNALIPVWPERADQAAIRQAYEAGWKMTAEEAIALALDAGRVTKGQ